MKYGLLYCKKMIHSVTVLLVLCMLALQFHSISAGENKTVSVETRNGVYEDVITEMESDVQTDVTITTGTATGHETDSGMIVDYESTEKEFADESYEFSEHYIAKDSTSFYEAEGWHEKSVSSYSPDMTIELVISAEDTETKEYYGEESGTELISGDVKETDNDGVYDYTVSTVVTQSKAGIATASVYMSDAQVDITDEVMEYVHNDTVASETNDLILNQKPVVIPAQVEIREGYGYKYIASDQYSTYFPAWDYNAPVASLPNEEPVYVDEETGLELYAGASHSSLKKRKLIVPKLYFEDKTVEGSFYTRWSTIEQFTVTDINGQKISAYCSDLATTAEEDYCYKISNLEDADYYSEEEAAMIRAIAGYGYWGSSSGYGSLAKFKENLQSSGKFSQEELDQITDGIALTAMQQSIWHFSNVMGGYVFVNAYKTNSPYIGTVTEEMDQDIAALIYKLFYHLISLDPSAIPEEDKTTENTIINDKNFLKKVSLTITGKEADHPNNLDSSDINDAYTADFTFTLKVKPSSENDDSLVLSIFNADMELIALGRIAGDLQEGEQLAEEVGDGVYVLRNVSLTEGDQFLSFALSGTQHLNNDVYMLKSEEIDDKTSQTMICVASGSHRVNIKLDVGFNLAIDGEKRQVEHFKRIETNNEVETVSIEVEKFWEDDNDAAGIRPRSITVHLLADGKEIDSCILNEACGWKHLFEDLPKYEGENLIVYTITEDPVPGYVTIIRKYTIVNRHTNYEVPKTGIEP